MDADRREPRDAVDRIELKTPCAVPWSTMRGDERVRHCDRCEKNVYNIAALTRPEALRLVANKEGGRCVRIFRRPDGTVVTADCSSRLRAARKKGIGPWLAALAVVGWAELSAARFGLSRLQELAERFNPKPTVLSVDWDVPVARLGGSPPAPAPRPEDVLNDVWVDEGPGGI
jgi:hypothetical protein